MTGHTERSVRRWLAGTNPPRGRARHRLTVLSRIAYYLEAAAPGSIVSPSAWIHAPNVALRGQVPLDIMVQGKVFQVAQFLGGGVRRGLDPYERPMSGRPILSERSRR